jgi:putative (di)nucleoside polyphosphate hydrolase
MIDSDGFRANVGIIIANGSGQVFWGQSVQQNDSWQFPQGGIDQGESARDAMYRELYEEVGLKQADVSLICQTRSWLRYRIPKNLIRKRQNPRCIGQKQKWFLLQLKADQDRIRFDCGEKEEFRDWRWVSYWYPVGQVVPFKKDVYRRAMSELSQNHVRLTRD